MYQKLYWKAHNYVNCEYMFIINIGFYINSFQIEVKKIFELLFM